MKGAFMQEQEKTIRNTISQDREEIRNQQESIDRQQQLKDKTRSAFMKEWRSENIRESQNALNAAKQDLADQQSKLDAFRKDLDIKAEYDQPETTAEINLRSTRAASNTEHNPSLDIDDMPYLFVKSSVALNFTWTGTRSAGF